VKIDRFVNRVLSKFFGPEDAQGNRHTWFHSQNLNEDNKGDVKGPPWEGRWWLHRAGRVVHTLDWRFGKKNWFLGFSVGATREDDLLSWSVGLPFLSLYLGHALPGGVRKLINTPFWAKWNEKYDGYKGSHRYTPFHIAEVRYSWMDGNHRLSWNFLKFDWGWSRKMPKWMDGSVDVQKALFGDMDYQKRILGKHEVFIPMPEGSYPATVEMSHCTWKRSRLPWNSSEGTYANIEIDIGIPHEGKGENSWDCGEDASFGLHCKAHNIEDAIGQMVTCVLRDRQRYNGNRMAKYPDPETRRKAVMKRREEAAAERAADPGKYQAMQEGRS
jgi:hypothetical protein